MSSSSNLFTGLPSEIIQQELALHLDLPSFSRLSQTSKEMHRVLSWKSLVHLVFTKYPDLGAGETYQAYYHRMRLGLLSYDASKRLAYAFNEELECLALQIIGNMKEPRSELDKVILRKQFKGNNPEIKQVYFAYIDHFFPATKKRSIVEWLQNACAYDNEIICNKKLVIKFLKEISLDEIETIINSRCSYKTTIPAVRILLLVNFSVLNDEELNNFMFADLSPEDREYYIKAALLYILSARDFEVCISHKLLAINALCRLLSNRSQFVEALVNNHSTCVSEVKRYLESNGGLTKTLQITLNTSPSAGLTWYLNVIILGNEPPKKNVIKENDLPEVLLTIGGDVLGKYFNRELSDEECNNIFSKLLNRRIAPKKTVANFFSLPSVAMRIEDIIVHAANNTHDMQEPKKYERLIQIKYDYPHLAWENILKKVSKNFFSITKYDNFFYTRLFRSLLEAKLVTNPGGVDEVLKLIDLSSSRLSKTPYYNHKLFLLLKECLRANSPSAFVKLAQHINHQDHYPKNFFVEQKDADRVLISAMSLHREHLITQGFRSSPEFNFTDILNIFIGVGLSIPDDISRYSCRFNSSQQLVDFDRFDLTGVTFARFDWLTSEVKNLDKAIFLSNDELDDPDRLKKRLIQLHQTQCQTLEELERFKKFSYAIVENILRYAREQSATGNNERALSVLKTALPLFGTHRTWSGEFAGQAVNQAAALGLSLFNRVFSQPSDIPYIPVPTARQRKILALIEEINSNVLVSKSAKIPDFSMQ